MSNLIPDVDKKAEVIANYLKSNPNSCKKYLLRLLGKKDKDNLCKAKYENNSSYITLYLARYKSSKKKLIGITGARYFDIYKLSKYLASTRFKVPS